MSPTIRVDDEVYAILQSHAEAFVDTPNLVLRRLLGLSGVSPGSTGSAPGQSAVPGKMQRLMRYRDLLPGEPLVWDRKQQSVTFKAVLTDSGALQLEDGRRFDTPSGAARHLAGYEVNGWRVWVRSRDGKSLEDIWQEHKARLAEKERS